MTQLPQKRQPQSIILNIQIKNVLQLNNSFCLLLQFLQVFGQSQGFLIFLKSPGLEKNIGRSGTPIFELEPIIKNAITLVLIEGVSPLALELYQKVLKICAKISSVKSDENFGKLRKLSPTKFPLSLSGEVGILFREQCYRYDIRRKRKIASKQNNQENSLLCFRAKSITLLAMGLQHLRIAH